MASSEGAASRPRGTAHAIVVLRETVDAEGAIGRPPWSHPHGRDVLRCAAEIDDRTVEDIASGRVLLVHPDDRVDVAARMLDQHTSHAVVVEPRTDRPVGAQSTLDIAGILGWGRG